MSWLTLSWLFTAVFLKLFYSFTPFSLSTRHFRSPSLIKQTQGSKFKEFYLNKVLNTYLLDCKPHEMVLKINVSRT